MFTSSRPVIFAYHGYPYLIHRLAYRRKNHENFHVRGFQEEGTTTTPFDMTVLNEVDRYHLAIEAIDRLGAPGPDAMKARRSFEDKLLKHWQYIRDHGEDMPEVQNWAWRNGA